MWISIKRFQTYTLGFVLLCGQGIALGQDSNWKAALKASFSRAADQIGQIIKQGETPAEAGDFAKRLDNQALWFDTTLAGTNSQIDSSYYLLNQRKIALSNIVAMQEWAERTLKERLATFAQPLPDYRRVRVLLLYEVNSAMNKKSGDGVAGVAGTSLTQSEIDEVVDRVLEQASQAVGVTLTAAVPVAPVAAALVAPEVVLKLDKLQAQVDQGIALSRQLQTAMRQGDDAAAKRLGVAVAQAEKRAMQECRNCFVPRLEAAFKGALGLQVIILDKNERLARSNDERNHWQAVAREAEQKAILTDDLADRRLAEQALFFDLKKTDINDAALGASKRGMASDEREHRPDQAGSVDVDKLHYEHLIEQQEAASREQLERELEQRVELERGLGK